MALCYSAWLRTWRKLPAQCNADDKVEKVYNAIMQKVLTSIMAADTSCENKVIADSWLGKEFLVVNLELQTFSECDAVPIAAPTGVILGFRSSS